MFRWRSQVKGNHGGKKWNNIDEKGRGSGESWEFHDLREGWAVGKGTGGRGFEGEVMGCSASGILFS